MYLAAVLFDLEKAFDKVDRNNGFCIPGSQSTDGRTGHVPRGDAQRHVLQDQGPKREDPASSSDLEGGTAGLGGGTSDLCGMV